MLRSHYCCRVFLCHLDFPINPKCRLLKVSGRCNLQSTGDKVELHIVLQSCNSTNELTILPLPLQPTSTSVCIIMCGFWWIVAYSINNDVICFGNIKQVSDWSNLPLFSSVSLFACGRSCVNFGKSSWLVVGCSFCKKRIKGNIC